jgi:hypothetical protein
MKRADDENRPVWLASALRDLSELDAQEGASAAVETWLIEEVRAIRRTRRLRTAALTLAAAAMVVIPMVLLMGRSSPRPVVTTRNVVKGPLAAAEGSAGTNEEFLPLIYSNVPMLDGQIVRMEVSRRALASFGLSSVDAFEGTPSGTVMADVLVGEDGLARGVRFVSRTAP